MSATVDDLTVMRDPSSWPDPTALRVSLPDGTRGYIEGSSPPEPTVELDGGGRIDYRDLAELAEAGWVLE